ncbi:MAG: NAD(P)H-hydrate dehydratase [Peptostreptococcus porci]|uniref:NAD(P)H-hydrate dehydratase n=1 Tax=Peptostreptococcus porci TaxID=2652282 RepID=UPI002A91571B|nr:NAD(P)H-hydrate dehydratase [Peptostreptococcus porci]MDY5479436.1 NAD(P)H-hydrate dehydratase [Peptostreptococcus porci]
MTLICDGEITKNIDKYCIENIGIPEIILMENAAKSAVDRIKQLSEEGLLSFERILFFCGAGNNGGDGFAMARHFKNMGADVDVIVFGDIKKMSPSTRTNLEIISNMDIYLEFLTEENIFELNDRIIELSKDKNLLIDCVFGVGLNREIDGYLRTAISSINEARDMYSNKLRLVSIDCPSGLNSTNGSIMGISIVSDFTVSFEFFKKGFLRYGAEKYTGEIFVEKIGVPENAVFDRGEYAEFIDRKYIHANLKSIESYVHKGDMGKVCLFAGSTGFTGAGFISTRACSRTGSGLTTLICDENIQAIMSEKLDEEMTCNINEWEKVSSLLEKSDAIAFGPGIGITEHKQKLLDFLIDKYDKPKVIDADGLKMIDFNWLHKKSNTIFTPHIGEFSQMVNLSVEEIESDRMAISKNFAKEHDVVLVLKGKNTIVTDGDRVMVNTTGNRGMANGGMGDALTGIILSLCGQGYDNFTAACIGVYLHGLCGDVVFEENNTVNATKLIKIIPNIMKILYNKN